MELNAMKEREEICDVCHKMWQRGIVAANDGNVSVKLEDGTFLCTPSGAPFLQEHDAILLAHHGALTVGESLTRAYFRMESLEMFAKTSLYIHLLGGAPDMPEDKINALMDLRQNGYKIPGRHPGYVKYNKPEEK